MGDVIITIIRSEPSTGTLTFSGPTQTANATPGDQITWVITPGVGVASISGIKNKPGYKDVFEKDKEPTLQPPSTSWMGTVNPNIVPGTEEKYTIYWTTAPSGWLNEGGGIDKSFDPIIQIKPKG
jgi:hypothetical protein